MANNSADAAAAPAATTTRIDDQHAVGVPAAEAPSAVAQPDPQSLSAVCGDEAGARTSQLSRQASQLAQHLRTRQRQLDARESKLNARLAGLESELRAARLYLHDREQGLDERETHIEKSVERSAAEEAQRDEARHQQQRAELDVLSSRIELRQRQLAEADSILHKQFQELAEETAKSQGQLAIERAAIEEDRQQLARQRREFEQYLAESNTNLEKRRQSLNEKSQTAKQLRDETFRLYQESLEQRFATEQAWQAMGMSSSFGERSQALSQARQRIAEHLRIDKQELAEERRALEALATKLDERAGELRRLRRESQVWLTSREAELEEQAARLVAREIELDREKSERERDREEWLAERRELRSQIRQLLAENREGQHAPEPA